MAQAGGDTPKNRCGRKRRAKRRRHHWIRIPADHNVTGTALKIRKIRNRRPRRRTRPEGMRIRAFAPTATT